MKKYPQTAYLLNPQKLQDCECEVYLNIRTKSINVSCLTCELTGKMLFNGIE